MLAYLGLRKIDVWIIVVGLLLTTLYATGHKVDGDVTQVLNNAYEFSENNNLIPYGNVSTSGAKGNTPGAFLSLITGVPMSIYASPYSALSVIALLHLISLILLVNVVKNYLTAFGVSVFVMIFWLSPWRAGEVFLWNPAYIYIASALHLWSAYHLSKNKSYFFSIVHGLSIFLGLQVHASFVLLVFLTLILLSYRSLKVNWYGCLSGIVLGFLSLLPYILAGLQNPDIFPRPGADSGSNGFLFFGLIKVYPLIKAVWYWCLFGSTIFQSHMFHEFNFSWLGTGILKSAIEYSWTGIKYFFGLLGIILSIRVNWQFFKSNKSILKIWKVKFEEKSNFLNYYICAGFVSLLIASAISPTEPIFWHLLYLWPIAILPISLFVNEKFKSTANSMKVQRIVIAVAVFFVFSNLFAALGSRKHDFFNFSFHDYYQKNYIERVQR
ncbi:MAG: hypothetical protein AB8E15_01350 [Bdellovibrionales bacterium]